MVLTFAYGYYLKLGASEIFYPDYITYQVAVQSEWFVTALGYASSIIPHPDEASMKLIVENHFVARVVEGCNGISVIILFTSFVIAFYQGIKKTILFLSFGWLLIYAINVSRIALISVGLYEIPQYSGILHDVFFPGIIYGTVVILWLVWIKQFKKSQD